MSVINTGRYFYIANVSQVMNHRDQIWPKLKGAHNVANGKHRWSSWQQERARIAEAGTCFLFYTRDRCFLKEQKRIFAKRMEIEYLCYGNECVSSLPCAGKSNKCRCVLAPFFTVHYTAHSVCVSFRGRGGTQSRQTVKYGRESRGTRKQ